MEDILEAIYISRNSASRETTTFVEASGRLYSWRRRACLRGSGRFLSGALVTSCEAWKNRRCLVPTDWFCEWQKIDEKTKQPYAIATKDDSMFAFAGLWESWKDKATGQKLRTFTILTTDPNELMESIHNRMPVILAPKDYERWMAPTDPAHLPVDLLKPYPAEEMKTWKVGRDVGKERRPEFN